ncbi:MAG: NifU family protein [Planctomycetota bacterium]|nr:MAG: NifU family protein [Planctomycetota bacterium]
MFPCFLHMESLRLMSTPDSPVNPAPESACSIAGQWAKKASTGSTLSLVLTADTPIQERVRIVFEQVINPELQRDGGSVEFIGVDSDRVVQMRLKGSCQGCASSAIRLSMMLESTVKAYVPEVRFLEVVV